MKIDFANLQMQYQKYKDDIDYNIGAVLNKSNYIMGEEVKQLEAELSAFTGTKHTITCSNGTDALLLAMMALDIQPGDEVITSPFTFISTAETIVLMKAKPVFVDIESEKEQLLGDVISAHPQLVVAGEGPSVPHWFIRLQDRFKRFVKIMP